jgi:hypothetical protein
MPRHLTGDRLLIAIDAQAWGAARKADALKADPELLIYAYLFDHAAQFWRDVLEFAKNGWPMGPDHRAALNWIARGSTKEES